jgi:hypothetical protein
MMSKDRFTAGVIGESVTTSMGIRCWPKRNGLASIVKNTLSFGATLVAESSSLPHAQCGVTDLIWTGSPPALNNSKRGGSASSDGAPGGGGMPH